VRYAFVQNNKQAFSVKLLSKVLKVSRSGYYDWQRHKPSKRAQANKHLDEGIMEVYHRHKRRYGSPRIACQLQISHTRVARRMKVMGLKAIARKKFRVTTDSGHVKPVYDNVLKRNFVTTALN